MNQPSTNYDPEEEWLDADGAAALLGVKRATLYAYVSRGAVRARPVAGTRIRMYSRADLLRLKARSAARAGHGAVAAGALRFGEPVLDTAVSAIDTELGPRYRGRVAIELAREGRSFEDAAALLWGIPSRAFVAPDPGIDLRLFRRGLPRDARVLEKLALLVPLLSLGDPDRYVTSAAPELERAQRLIVRMVSALAPSDDDARRARTASTVARALAIALGTRMGAAVRAIDRTLLVCADHELNVSTFAARVVASSGADLYACVSAALAALSGPAHGGVCDRVEAFLEEIDRPEDAARVVRERLARGDPLVGFAHPLYPNGDPRGAFLIDEAARLAPNVPTVRKVLALREAVRLAGAGEPTLDHGLVAIAGAARLPPMTAVALFAVGRMAGWVAHVREQRESGQLVRPRARYVDSSTQP